jgi:hypothetical protein
MAMFSAALSMGKFAALAETQVARQSSTKMSDYPQSGHLNVRSAGSLFFSASPPHPRRFNE